MIADVFSFVLFPSDVVKNEESTNVDYDPFNYHRDNDIHKKFLWNYEHVEDTSSGDGAVATGSPPDSNNAAIGVAGTAYVANSKEEQASHETVMQEKVYAGEHEFCNVTTSSFFMGLHGGSTSKNDPDELDNSLEALTRQVLSIFDSSEDSKRASEVIKDEDADVLKLLSFIMPELMDKHNNASDMPLHLLTEGKDFASDDINAACHTSLYEVANVKAEGHEETSSTAVKNELDSVESWTTTTDTTSSMISNQLEEDDRAWLAAAAVAAKIIPQKKKTIKMIKRVPRWVIVIKRNKIKPAKPNIAKFSGEEDSDDDGDEDDEEDNNDNNDNDSFVSNLYSEADVDDEDCLPEATIQVLGDVFDGVGGIDDDGDEDDDAVDETKLHSSFNENVSFMSSLPPSGCWDHLNTEGGQ